MREVVAIAALLLLPALAAAHSYPVERAAVLQLHPAHAELLLIYKEPAGPRTDRLLALYDQDKNGAIDGVEVHLATPEILRRAFAGVTFDFGAPHKAQRAELNFKRDVDGGVSVAILQRFDVTLASTARLTVRLDDGAAVVPLQVIIEPVGWTFDGSDATEQRVELTHGQSSTAQLRRAPTN